MATWPGPGHVWPPAANPLFLKGFLVSDETNFFANSLISLNKKELNTLTNSLTFAQLILILVI